MPPITIEVLAERIDALRELMNTLHDKRIERINELIERVNEINGQLRSNKEFITSNRAGMGAITGRISKVETQCADNNDRIREFDKTIIKLVFVVPMASFVGGGIVKLLDMVGLI